jgi:tetratricopeptide (TPR) repeat protein
LGAPLAIVEKRRIQNLGQREASSSRVEALTEQASALTRADQVQAAKAPALAAIDIAGAAGLVVEMGLAASLFNHAHVWTNEGYGILDQSVIAALERTLAAIGDSDVVRRADLLGALASELVFADPERHRAVCAEAESTARQAGDPQTLARVLIDVMLPNSPTDADTRLARAGEILTLVDAHDLPGEGAFAGYHHTAAATMELADFDGAVEATARARRALDASPGSKFRSQLYWFEASMALIQGRYDQAASLIHEAHELHRRARGYDADGMLLIGQVAIATDIGGLEHLIDFAVAVAMESTYERATAESMAFSMVELGKVDIARKLVKPYGASTAFVDDWTTLFSATAALHVRVELESLEGVAGLYELLTPYSGRWSCCGTSPINTGLVDLALARAAAALGDTDRAVTLFDTAVSEHERIGALSWLARSLVHQGNFLRETFGTASGDAALKRAADLADRHGFPYVRRRLDLAGRAHSETVQ